MDLKKREGEVMDGEKKKEGKIESVKEEKEVLGGEKEKEGKIEKAKAEKDVLVGEKDREGKIENAKAEKDVLGGETEREVKIENAKAVKENGGSTENVVEKKKEDRTDEEEKKGEAGVEEMKKATEDDKNENETNAREKKKEADIEKKAKAIGTEKKENVANVEEEKKETGIEEKEVQATAMDKASEAQEDKKENETNREKKREARIEEMKTAKEEDNKENETNAEEKKKEADIVEKMKAVAAEKKENEANKEEEKKETRIEEKEVKATETDKGKEEKVEEKKANEITEEEKRETEMEEKKTETEADEKKDKEAETGETKEEEKHCSYDLKENEKKALFEFRTKLEEAILEGKMFKKNNDDAAADKKPGEKQEVKSESQEQLDKPEKEENQNQEEKKKPAEEENEKDEKPTEEVTSMEVDKDISLWGVPLLPSKEDETTDTVLLKFLKARDFHVNDALEMLKNTLQWRRENKIDSIIDEDFGDEEFSRFAFMGGDDRDGLPVCYNVFGVFAEDGKLEKLMSNEEKKNRFLRWRVQLMERGIKKLDWRPGGVSTMIQICDLNNTPLPSKKDLRAFIRQVVTVFQDNYPEFVSRMVFINVPFWYYAYTAILSPFSTQRMRSKFVFARPAKAYETLLKYVSAEQMPVNYGGLMQDNDSEFSVDDTAMEVMIKSGSVETIEIPAPEVGRTVKWDVLVSGGEVNYREEFVPTDEKSYTVIVKKNTKMGLQEGPIRNSFKNSEPGKIVIFLDNSSFKKKRVFYRHKTSDC